LVNGINQGKIGMPREPMPLTMATVSALRELITNPIPPGLKKWYFGKSIFPTPEISKTRDGKMAQFM